MSKAPEKAASADDAAPVVKSKKKLIVMISAATFLLAVVGGGATFFLTKKDGSKEKEKEHKAEPAKPPVFLPLEAFVVNLQSESGDKYLQVTMTLQVPDEEQANLLKLNMPQIRSRLLMLLSSKDTAEILTSEGKTQLIKEIVDQVKIPFAPKGSPQKVVGVFFTSFVVQ